MPWDRESDEEYDDGFTRESFERADEDREGDEPPPLDWRGTRGLWKFAICHRCEGHGTVDHPAFSNGITGEEWAEWDPEDRQAYLDRRYDVPCGECRGSGKVKVPDVRAMTFAQRRLLVLERRDLHERARYEAEWRRERDMEARMLGEY